MKIQISNVYLFYKNKRCGTTLFGLDTSAVSNIMLSDILLELDFRQLFFLKTKKLILLVLQTSNQKP
jgi:hypothetical protein